MSPRVSHNRVVETAGERWIGDFVLQEELGRGGMGVVYKALRPSDGALAAIKILPLAMSLDDARLRRFEREGRLAQQVRHPNLVCVEESGRLADGTLYLRMELLRGPTLRDALAEAGGRLNPQDALTACLQIARGLAAMHAAGIVHRDIKPFNFPLLDLPKFIRGEFRGNLVRLIPNSFWSVNKKSSTEPWDLGSKSVSFTMIFRSPSII